MDDISAGEIFDLLTDGRRGSTMIARPRLGGLGRAAIIVGGLATGALVAFLTLAVIL